MIFSEANAVLSLFDRLSHWFCRRRTVESVAMRVISLFEAHGVHRNQIPRLLGRGLTPAAVQTDESLMAALTDEMIDAAAALFAVRRDWLDGATDEIYPLHDFYKKPDEFSRFIAKLRNQSPGSLDGAVLTANTNWYESHEEDTLIVVQQKVGAVGERPVFRYYLCNNWIFGYWKARAYLTACVAIAGAQACTCGDAKST